MKLFLTQGSHWDVPGTALLASRTRDEAVREAVQLVNIMKRDSKMPYPSTEDTWESDLAKLQEKHGAQYTDVSITEIDMPDRSDTSLAQVRAEVKAYDDVLNSEGRAPTGDDYNALWSIMMGDVR